MLYLIRLQFGLTNQLLFLFENGYNYHNSCKAILKAIKKKVHILPLYSNVL